MLFSSVFILLNLVCVFESVCVCEWAWHNTMVFFIALVRLCASDCNSNSIVYICMFTHRQTFRLLLKIYEKISSLHIHIMQSLMLLAFLYSPAVMLYPTLSLPFFHSYCRSYIYLRVKTCLLACLCSPIIDYISAVRFDFRFVGEELWLILYPLKFSSTFTQYHSLICIILLGFWLSVCCP